MSTGTLHGMVSVHALGEVWSVLTKLPVTPLIEPKAAREAVQQLLIRFEAMPLTAPIYGEALDRCAARGLRSGAIFDALHLATAEASGAPALLTFNERDFTRLSVAGGPVIVVPPDPPAVVL